MHKLNMEKVSTAKKTEQVLNEEIKSSIKEALKEAHFKQTAVGARLAGESTKERMKQIARAEVLKKNEYPEFMGGEGTADEKRVYNKLVKLLEGAEKGLKFLLGDNFIAISLCGSWAKGYAKRKSDVDLYLLLKHESVEVDDALGILHYMGREQQGARQGGATKVHGIKGSFRKGFGDCYSGNERGKPKC